MQSNRSIRLRKKLKSKSDRARLSVFLSNKHIYAQIIDDSKGVTVISASDRDIKAGKNSDIAREVGVKLAKEAIKLGVKDVVLDRGDRRYHGRIKVLAEAAREGGLNF